MTDEAIEAEAREVVMLANQAAAQLEAHRRMTERNATLARAQAAKVRDSAVRSAAEAAAGRSREGRAASARLAAALAPGPLAADWASAAFTGNDVRVLDAAAHVRCGSLVRSQRGEPSVEVPLIVPLLDAGNVRLVGSSANRAAIGAAVQEIALRSLLGTGAGQLSLLTFDPKLTASLALFTSLRQASEEVVRPALSSSEDLRGLLEGLARDVRRITDMYAGAPATLGAFRAATGQPIEHYQLVTILDYPTGFDQRLHDLLLTLLRTGPRCGISFLLHHDPAVLQDGVHAEELDPLVTTIDLDGAGFARAPGYTVQVGARPDPAVTERVLGDLAAQIRKAAAPRIDFRALQPGLERMWSDSTADRVAAVIGRIGHHPIEVVLGDEIEQKHNVLVTGAVGQGKSNLLMALIHSWAVRYSPAELELYLLDFKDGVTLYPLAPNSADASWLPHARVLGLESDRSFGLAVLEHLVAEFERRAGVIKPYGDNIARFRAERPRAVMPRLVAVIDEFQVLFEEDDDVTAAALLALDRLAKRGRAYGIHLVLASQTLSGITALVAKQDGIFSQFPIRLALHNSAAESRVVLSQGNTEAARLRYRGEIVVNKDFGEIDGNRRGVVAYADPDELRVLRRSFVARDARAHVPVVFNGALPADVRAFDHAIEGAEVPTAFVGVSIGVESKPFGITFDDSTGRHLALLGTGRRTDGSPGNAAADTLQSAALTLARTARSARFVILSLLGLKDAARGVVDELRETFERIGVPVEMVEGASVAARLRGVEEEIAARRAGPSEGRLFVVGFGLDRLPQPRVIDFSSGAAPVDAMHAIWREGPSVGVHLLGWWSNVRAFQDQVGLEAQGFIDAIIAFKVPTEAVVDLFGPFVTWKGQDNRAIVRDSAVSGEPVVVVPFGPQRSEPASGPVLQSDAAS